MLRCSSESGGGKLSRERDSSVVRCQGPNGELRLQEASRSYLLGRRHNRMGNKKYWLMCSSCIMKRNKSKWSKVIVTNLVSSRNLSKLQPLYAVDLAMLSARAECSKGQNVCGHGPHVVQSLLPASICSHPLIH